MQIDGEGLQNLLWFMGIVEMRDDPTGQGRIKVRVFGMHPPLDTNEVLTEDLPWAYIVDGTGGAFFSIPETGDWVFGFFMDGRDAQHPFVVGIIRGANLAIPYDGLINSAALADSAAPETPNDPNPDDVTQSDETTTETTGDQPQGAQVNTGDMSGDIVDYVASKEGFSENAYWDYGHYSIGHGTRASGPNEGPITRDEARARLVTELSNSRNYVVNFGEANGYNWTPGQVDALSSFAYNGGNGFIDQVTANGTRDNTTIASSMLLYVNAGGQPLPGLVVRREEESSMFSNATVAPR